MQSTHETLTRHCVGEVRAKVSTFAPAGFFFFHFLLLLPSCPFTVPMIAWCHLPLLFNSLPSSTFPHQTPVRRRFLLSGRRRRPKKKRGGIFPTQKKKHQLLFEFPVPFFWPWQCRSVYTYGPHCIVHHTFIHRQRACMCTCCDSDWSASALLKRSTSSKQAGQGLLAAEQGVHYSDKKKKKHKARTALCNTFARGTS